MPNYQPPVNNYQYQPLVNDQLAYITLQNVLLEEVRELDSICDMNEIPSNGLNNEMTEKNDQLHLKIIEQPADTFRYRYKSEKGSHGGIKGENTAHSKKSFPTVKLENCSPDLRKKIVIKVSLYTNEPHPKPHVYDLIGKNANGVTLDEEFHAKFQYLAISTRKREEVLEILKERKREYCVPYDEAVIEAEVLEEIKNFNCDSAKLCFEAFLKEDLTAPLCERIFSNPINNQKSAATGDLKIVRLSRCSGKCSGGDEVWLLCDKIKKDDIKVLFFDEETNWEAYGEFIPNEIHHQVVIILKTPPYPINVPKNVFMKLVRPSDSKYSEARPFEYIPDENLMPLKRKLKIQTATVSPLKNEISGILSKRRKVALEEDAGTSLRYLENSSVTDSPQSAEDEVSISDLPNDMDLDLLSTLDDDYSLHQFFHNLLQDNSPIEGQMGIPFSYTTELNSQDLVSPHSMVLNISPSFVKTDSVSEIESSMDSISLSDQCSRQEPEIPQIQKPSSEFVSGMKQILQSRDERTYLHYATQLILLQDEEGNSMLHLGIIEQNENWNFISKIVKLASKDVINYPNKSKDTPLHLAVQGNHVKILFLLLYRGGDPNIPDRNGNTCLHLAAKFGHIDCLKLLLPPAESRWTWKHAISDIDAFNYDGMSALHMAVMGNSEECVNFLLKSDSDINLSEMKSGRTSLHLALEKPSVLQTILKQPDLDIDIEDFGGYTALQLACLKTAQPFDVVSAELKDKDEISKFLLSLDYGCKESDEDSCEFEDAEEDFSSTSPSKVMCKATSPSDRICTNEKSNLMKIEEELSRYLDRDDNWKKLADLINLDTRCVALLDEGLSPGQTVLRNIKDLYHPCHLSTVIGILKVAGLEEGAHILERNS